MPHAFVPTNFKATRRILSRDGTLDAQPGDIVAPPLVAKLRNASAIISRHWLIPLNANGDPVDMYGRKVRAQNPRPTQVGPAARVALAAVSP